MKNISLIILLSVLCHCATAQTEVEFSKVIQVDNVSASDLYARAEKWFQNTFRKSNEKIEYGQGKEAIVAIGEIDYNQIEKKGLWQWHCIIRYEATVFVKNGRYKYSFNKFDHTATYYQGTQKMNLGILNTSAPSPIINTKSGKTITEMLYAKAISEIDDHILPLIQSLEKSMATASDAVNNDW